MQLHGLHGLLQAIIDSEKVRYCFECGKCTAACPMVELFPESYNPRILLHNISLNPEKIMPNKELWLCTWCYRCAKRCPQNLAIPEILLAARRKAKEHGFLDGFQEAEIEMKADQWFTAKNGGFTFVNFYILLPRLYWRNKGHRSVWTLKKPCKFMVFYKR